MPAHPTEANVPSYSGTFTPVQFSQTLLASFLASTCLTQIATTAYEKDVARGGDRIVIRIVPDIESRTYVDGQDITYDTITPSTVEIWLDHTKIAAMYDFDIQHAQADVDYLSRTIQQAVDKQKIAIEQDVFANVPLLVSSDNSGATAGRLTHKINLGAPGSPVELSETNIVEKIFECDSVLKEQNVTEEPWIVLPDFACRLLKVRLATSRLGSDFGNAALRSGEMGRIAGYPRIFASNTLYQTSEGGFYALFGIKSALAFVTQFGVTEKLRDPRKLGTLFRTAQTYGYNVIRPEGIGTLYCKPATA